MRDDFCIMVLSHGRPERMYTLVSLRASGYTGKLYIVVDNEDETRDQYIERFGDAVIVFDKSKQAETTDTGDNFKRRDSVLYARNATFEIAKQVGCKYFMQLDDDYTHFAYKFNHRQEFGDYRIYSLDDVLEAMIEYYETIPAKTLTMAQTGDFIGGADGTFGKAISLKRKAMNTFLCSADRPFQFVGRMNDDVNTYTLAGLRGDLMLTYGWLCIQQRATQSSAGGLTEMYLDFGTYVKSFYTIMYAPSCTKISTMGQTDHRIHHRITWDNACPKLLHEKHKRTT
jgi:hypothetical protein